LTTASQPAIPTVELWGKIRPLIADVPEWVDELVQRIEAEREVVGSKTSGIANKDEGPRHTIGAGKSVEVDITAPATPAAQQWQGWGTALKPAHEPIVVARKPLIGTVAANVLTYGTGALNIDASRVAHQSEADRASATPQGKVTSNLSAGAAPDVDNAGRVEVSRPDTSLGRWPANVIHDGSEEVLEGFPSVKTGSIKPHQQNSESDSFGLKGKFITGSHLGDSGSAARFFYCAKASKSERNAGLGELPKQEQHGSYKFRTDGSLDGKETEPKANIHPTVKPIALMRYLVKLVTPPNGTVLDPFLGSGTTAVAAILEGFNWMGCEMTKDYWPIIEARVAWAEAQPKTLL